MCQSVRVMCFSVGDSPLNIRPICKLDLLFHRSLEPRCHDIQDTLVITPEAFAFQIRDVEIEETILLGSNHESVLLFRVAAGELCKRDGLKLGYRELAVVGVRTGRDLMRHDGKFCWWLMLVVDVQLSC